MEKWSQSSYVSAMCIEDVNELYDLWTPSFLPTVAFWGVTNRSKILSLSLPVSLISQPLFQINKMKRLFFLIHLVANKSSYKENRTESTNQKKKKKQVRYYFSLSSWDSLWQQLEQVNINKE